MHADVRHEALARRLGRAQVCRGAEVARCRGDGDPTIAEPFDALHYARDERALPHHRRELKRDEIVLIDLGDVGVGYVAAVTLPPLGRARWQSEKSAQVLELRDAHRTAHLLDGRIHAMPNERLDEGRHRCKAAVVDGGPGKIKDDELDTVRA